MAEKQMKYDRKANDVWQRNIWNLTGKQMNTTEEQIKYKRNVLYTVQKNR